MRIGLFIISFCFLGNIFSQENKLLNRVKVPVIVDTLFIDHDVNNYSLRVYTSYKDNRFQLSNDDHNIRYKPNNPFGIGIGIATKKVVLDVGFNIKAKSKEPTERIDLQMTIMLKQHHMDIFLQSYQGFNVNSDTNHDNIFREDFKSVSAAANYMYIFNAQEYSFSAMKSGLSRQKISATSFGLGAFFSMNRTSADSSFVPSDLQGNFNEQAQITNLSSYGGGVLCGFTLTVPFLKALFVSASIIPGIGLAYQEVQTESLKYKPTNPMLYQLASTGIIGHNGKKFYINFSTGISFFYTDLSYNNYALYNTIKTKFAVGYKLARH